MEDMGTSHEFHTSKHIKFLKRCLDILPERYASVDTNRLTVAFFALSGLDILGAIESVENRKSGIIDWIYSLQYLPSHTVSNSQRCGFRGSSANGAMYEPNSLTNPGPVPYDSGHIAMTYSALLTLLILGDDLSRVNREAVIEGITSLQLPNGSFCPTIDGSENDMRFVYCACCISYILNNWNGINTEKALEYIVSSINYDGGIGQGPHLEAHGGSTFCAVASLYFMDRLDTALSSQQLERLKRWCIIRQESGFQGRPNKPVDTCYSFWIGATLKLLEHYDHVNIPSNRSYILSTQDNVVGGLSKWPDTSPDALHTYFGICGLSLLSEPGLKSMNPALNISQTAADHLHRLQDQS